MRFRSHRQDGEGRGKILGFPTVNFDSGMIPSGFGMGVYRCKLYAGGAEFDGVLHYGPKKTFGGTIFTLEVHIFDFSPEADAPEAEIEIFERLRNVTKFESEAAL